MKVLDEGHRYELNNLDGGGTQFLCFVKREGEGYPGNVGHHQGTTSQEVMRALINRAKYVDGQESDPANQIMIMNLRDSILALEQRAARRHGRKLRDIRLDIEDEPTCASCGHIQCNQTCERAARGEE